MRAGNIYQFKNLSKFKDVEEFNQHKETFLQQHPDLFTKSEFIAFEVLSQYSVVVPGVANAKIDTLVTACMKKQGKVSRSTYIRMLRKAKNAGILKVHKTYRSSGGFAHNIFVFQKFEPPGDTEMTQREKPETTCGDKDENIVFAGESMNLSLNLKNKDLNIRQEKDVHNHTSSDQSSIKDKDLDYTFVPDTIPQNFIQTVKPFFDRAVEIYTFWGKALIAHKKLNFDVPLESMTSVVINAFKTTVFHLKHRKIKKSFIQYYYGTLMGMFSAIKRRENRGNRKRPNYNWLDV
ncbi:hypothetical protein [Bacillus sp. NEB1478]|uniref:hypothetical protein n=1 Tax=Bacillus sp. NEB1478 TaxID=3073816 RepID=UPI002872BB75|nr:hypothetical protein [Bacillus sp. NEB1478]WNB92493.1 hypothetical protein RGB74_02170 [Bacillus sp. NEB1478]